MHDVFVEGGLIRKLWSIETSAYRDHLLRLDVESRHNLFAGAIPDEIIRTSAATALRSDLIIYGFFVEGVLRGAAEMHILWPPHWGEAEAAFSIEKPWQSHGVGSALLESSLLVARNRSIKLLHVNCLADNQRMQRLARKFRRVHMRTPCKAEVAIFNRSYYEDVLVVRVHSLAPPPVWSWPWPSCMRCGPPPDASSRT